MKSSEIAAKRKERQMKLFRLLALCITALCLFALFACGAGGELDAPLGVEVEYETLTLRWDEVEGARTYVLQITPKGAPVREITVSKSYYSLESLDPGEYEISVRAVGSGGVGLDLSKTVAFTRDEECGLVFELVSRGEYSVSSVGSATGSVSIPATYRGKPVTAVGEKAFFNSGDLTEVVIPESVRTVGPFAFANCSSLERVELPSGLVRLGESAFSGCRSLCGVLAIPEGVKEIPKGAFAYCSRLEGIGFTEGLCAIGDNAFTDCSHLSSLSFPASLERIGGFAFAACSSVGGVTFSEGIEEIGEFAFSKAVSLTSVTLPESLVSLGNGAFYYCSSLASITLGSGLQKMGNSAFLETVVYNNSPTNEIYVGNWFVGLRDTTARSIDIREGTVGIASDALYANSYIASLELPNSVEYICSGAFAGGSFVSVVTGSGVKRIDERAFLFCEKLIDVVLGSYDYTDQTLRDSSLEYIGSYCFMNCPKLARIDIPETVRDIGAYAFRNTEIFKSAMTGAVYADNWIVDFNDTVTEEITVDPGTVGIARYSFYNCRDLRSIKIDNSVRYIGKGAFYNCTSLERVSLPDTLERIEDYTFYSCTSLKLAGLPPMLREIGRAAFYLCGSAGDNAFDTEDDVLEIPGGVTRIGDFAFFGCGYRSADAIDGEAESSGIDTVVIGPAVEYIGRCAFRGFSSLKNVVIYGAVEIGEKAFCECPSLETVKVESGLLYVGDKAFYKCRSLSGVSFPGTLLTVGNLAFFGCDSLGSIKLGSSLESIGERAFLGASALEDIALPPSLTRIGEQAFRDCTSLSSLTLGGNINFIGSHAFYGCDALTLYLSAELDVASPGGEWNSTFVPVIGGCELSADGYVSSVTALDIAVRNCFIDTVLGAPKRDGYVFLGWSRDAATSAADAELDAIRNIASGEKLFAVWGAKE